MATVVQTIPKTGTFLLLEFLDYIGQGYLHSHLVDIPTEHDIVIITVRDPALQFLSWRKRNNKALFTGLLETCVVWQKQLLAIAEEYDPFIVYVDRGADIGKEALRKLSYILKGSRPASGYGWPVVNSINDNDPTTMDEFRSVSVREHIEIMDAMNEYRVRWGYAA